MSDIQTYTLEDLAVGMSASDHHTVSEQDIQAFAAVSGDYNPVHMDEAFAAQTMFKGRIAHGMLSAAYISKVLGTQLPGQGAIYLSQMLKFRAPVRIGDRVETTVTITDIDPKKGRVTLDTVCRVGDVEVIRGEAQLLAPKKAG